MHDNGGNSCSQHLDDPIGLMCACLGSFGQHDMIPCESYDGWSVTQEMHKSDLRDKRAIVLLHVYL
jgi:hypothetical protein